MVQSVHRATRPSALIASLAASAGLAGPALAQCHDNPDAEKDMQTVLTRGDVAFLPGPLQSVLAEMARRPHSALPTQAYAEADDPSELFQYYLLDADHFEPNVFTSVIPGVNDSAQLTAEGGPCAIPTIGSVRLVVEPKPGLPTDPSDVGAFIDVFTDIHGLYVINNESGWYEGWMIHDLTVAPIAKAHPGGRAKFGTITAADAKALKQMGSHHNVPGEFFTADGNDVRFPSAGDHFPGHHGNVAPIQLSMGAYNSLQQSDAHAYWEFNYTTNWVFPLYELPYTGGTPGSFEGGRVGRLQSIVPGSGPRGIVNDPVKYGDNPFLPRDPDKFEADIDSQREFRQRFIPSGLANEVYLDVYERLASFEPGIGGFARRLFDAYAAEVARVDQNHDGVISALEGDLDTASDGFDNNERLFIPPTEFNRFAVTREINDGLLAPRFAPSQKAWLLSGFVVSVDPPVPASQGRDGDDR